MGFKLRMEGSALAELEQQEALASEKGPAAYQAYKEASAVAAKQTAQELGTDTGSGEAPAASSSDSGGSDDSGDSGDSGGSGDGVDSDNTSDSFEVSEFDEDGDGEDDESSSSDDDKEKDDASETEKEDSADTTDEAKDEETEVKQESLRSLSFLPQEDQKLHMEVFGMAASNTWAGFAFVGAVLATIGLKVTPYILNGMFKVVLFTFAKTFKVLGSLYDFCGESIERFVNRTSKQKEKLSALKELLNSMQEKGMVLNPDNPAQIDARTLMLREDNNVLSNVQKYVAFLDTRVMALNYGLLSGLKDIENIASARYFHKELDYFSMMQVHPERLGFSHIGSSYSNENGLGLYSMGPMIGNAEVQAKLDANYHDNWHAVERSYRSCSVYIVPATGMSKTTAAPLDPERLSEFINYLEQLAEVSLKHQLFYEEISKSRSGLINRVKSLFIQLCEEKVKVSFKDSVALPLCLKSEFITKVYLTGALDLHDHTARVIAAGIGFANECMKHYEQQSQ